MELVVLLKTGRLEVVDDVITEEVLL